MSGVRVELPEAEGKRVIGAIVGFITSGARMMDSIGKKLEWQAEEIQRRIPVTQTEQNRENELALEELNLRELRTEVEREEYVARREKAAADLADAQLRKRTTLIRSQNLNRNVHRSKDSNGRPTQPFNQQTRSQPAVNERRNQLEGTVEGKAPLTQSLGEKMQAVKPAS